MLEAFKAEYYTEVQNLLDGYSAAVDMAEEKAQSSSSGLGKLFNRDDYPSLGSLREKFSFKLAFIPLPKPEDDSDFRLQVGEEMKEYLKQSYKDYYDQNREMMVRVYSDVRTRLVETKSKLPITGQTNTHRVSQHPDRQDTRSSADAQALQFR